MNELPLTGPDGKALPREYRFTGAELALEAHRELGMRVSVYARRVQDGSMSAKDASRKIAMAKAIHQMLLALPGTATYTVKA